MPRLSTWKKLLLAIVFGGVAVAGLAYSVARSGQWALAGAVADLDAAEPGWRVEDLRNAYNASLPPADRNPFNVATTVFGQLPANWTPLSTKLTPLPGPPNARLTPVDRALVGAVVAASGPSLATTDRLVGLPPGGPPLTITAATVTSYDLTPIQNLRSVSDLAQFAAVHHADAGRMPEALRCVRAGLGVSRGAGEPMMIARLIAMHMAASAAHSAARVLNLGDHPSGLAELQADFEQAAAVDTAEAVRGERAFMHAALVADPSGRQFGPDVNVSTADHTEYLRIMTAFISASDRPPESRLAALATVPRPASSWFHGPSQILPGMERITESGVRTHAELAATAIAIACERDRQRTGQWPAALAAIPRDILANIPTDPFTGRPLLYKRLPDGVVVYSVGPDATDDGGDVWDGVKPAPKDYGLRLWDPAKRGVTPPTAASPAPE